MCIRDRLCYHQPIPLSNSQIAISDIHHHISGINFLILFASQILQISLLHFHSISYVLVYFASPLSPSVAESARGRCAFVKPIIISDCFSTAQHIVKSTCTRLQSHRSGYHSCLTVLAGTRRTGRSSTPAGRYSPPRIDFKSALWHCLYLGRADAWQLVGLLQETYRSVIT